MTRRLTTEERERWEGDGFVIVRNFARAEPLEAMFERVTTIAERADAGLDLGDSYVMWEKALRSTAASPVERLSKVFRVHRTEDIFRAFCEDDALLDLVASLIGDELDCFLSQFIFKHPGALGQPWHQDAFYFPFDRGPQIGAWLAVTAATKQNGPLWVLPGSHHEPVHAVEPDAREHANYGYVEITDHDMAAAVPVLMQPGDLLLFHSHLMHMSTDNDSDTMRAAMVYHFAEAGTIDESEKRWGRVPPNVDWMPVRRTHREPEARDERA